MLKQRAEPYQLGIAGYLACGTWRMIAAEYRSSDGDSTRFPDTFT
jgi:hypothetical protein